ncbi:MAG: hypothetical protein HC830_10740 [Bacteroidetes bacterium]|nr:hypothetical protein [Bacteroidota bacterium]
MFSCSNQINQKAVYSFNPDSLVKINGKIIQKSESKVFRQKTMLISVEQGKNSITLTSGKDSLPWEKAAYLVCELWHNNPYSLIVYADFYKKDGKSATGTIVQQGSTGSVSTQDQPRISPKVGILPDLKTKLIIPLSHLDGQQIFMDRFPRQLKGTVMGRRLDKTDIGRVVLRFEPVMSPDYLPIVEIAAVYLTDSLPEPFEKPEKPYVDEFGQWNLKEWPGKTHSEKELTDNFRELELLAIEAKLPESWSRFGGWKEKKFNSTGYFKVHNDGKRWWFVDPDGFAFLSAGIDCIGSNVTGTVSGQEDLFAWLPSDSLYASAYTNRKTSKLINYLDINLTRTFGETKKRKMGIHNQRLIKRLAYKYYC